LARVARTFAISVLAIAVAIAWVLGVQTVALMTLSTLPEVLVFVASVSATFVGMMLSDETNNRLKSGALSGLTGAAAGGLGAILDDNNEVLLLVGLAGSGIGLFLGWLVALVLCTLAGFPRGDHLRYMLTYFTTGLTKLKEELEEDRRRASDEEVVAPLFDWQEHFAYRMRHDVGVLESSHDPKLIETTIRSWLVQLTFMLNMVFRITNRLPFRPRFSVILFDKACGQEEEDAAPATGRHWVFEHSGRKPFDSEEPFSIASDAYRICARLVNSPYFSHTGDTGDKRGQGNVPYYLFRVSSRLCMTVDWPELAGSTDGDRQSVPMNLFVQMTKSIVEMHLAPQMKHVFEMFRDTYPPFGGVPAADEQPRGDASPTE